MKLLSYTLGAIILFTFGSCQEKKVKTDLGLSLGALHISKSKPAPGDSLQISYKVMVAENDDDELHVFYTYFVNNVMYPADIPLTKTYDLFTGSLVIPDSATALVYHFKTAEEYEANGKKGYTHPLYGIDGDTLAGGMASLGYFYLTGAEYYGIKADKDSVLTLMENDLKNNMEIVEEWDKVYPRLLFRENAEKGEKWIGQRINNYAQKPELNDQQYQNLINFHRILGNQEKADSIIGIGIGKYPKGIVAENQAMDKFFKEQKKPEKQKEAFEAFVKQFGKSSRDYDFMLSMMANAAADEKDYDTFDSYLSRMENSFQKAGTYNNIAWNMVENGKDLEKANKFSKESLNVLKAMQEPSAKKPTYYSEKQFKDAIKSNYLMNVDTYAFILSKQGKKEEALQYQLEAIGEEKVGRPDVNERYVQFLLANNKHDEAQKEAARFIKINKQTPKIKDYLKDAYVANTGSKERFSEFLEDLEIQANQEALAETKKKMIDEESHNFTLRNLNGDEVILSSLRGKTVILDFWATWCGPCKDSFPGMQMAINKYKDDPNVVFLFIDTMEAGDFEKREQLVRDFILENKYTFNVLFDNPVKEGSRSFVTTNDYEIKGIPTKIIVGPDGRVKFKSVGYMGSTDQLVAELDLMIGLAQSKDVFLN
ncbi:TlpA family protein disulfide reductase [Maribacter halichondriae]|uniref:TlpA family protein disulfide reductase n=1 Tax=Maribacter halichondriae TaxID=2980554 RepID=UPI00235997A3|nr:redoxin domain-containing protein [Maribacter sp. Hal144]